MPYADSPPHMRLVNMITGEDRPVQFNPEQFSEAIAVNYAKLQVVGLSHTRQHFVNTDDVRFEFELWSHAIGGAEGDLTAIKRDRLFLYSLTHPWRADGIKRGGPPRVLFIWPDFISLTCVVKNLSFQYTQFNKNAHPIAWKSKIVIDEIRDVFVSMEDILNGGTQRSDTGAGVEDGGEL